MASKDERLYLEYMHDQLRDIAKFTKELRDGEGRKIDITEATKRWVNERAKDYHDYYVKTHGGKQQMARRKVNSTIRTYEQAEDFLRRWGNGKPNEGAVRENIRRYGGEGGKRLLARTPFPARTDRQYYDLMSYARVLRGVVDRILKSRGNKGLEGNLD